METSVELKAHDAVRRSNPRLSSSSSIGPSLNLAFNNLTLTRNGCATIDKATGIISGNRLTAIVNCSGTHNDSILLHALTGREECASGTIMMNGTPVDALVYQQHTVLIDEGFLAFEELTVRENIQYAASMRVTGATQRISVDDVITGLLLEDIENKVLRLCSPYVRRRVALGRELLRNPSLLCLDQPLEHLRTHEAQQFLGLLRRIASLVTPTAQSLEVSGTLALSDSANRATAREGGSKGSTNSRNSQAARGHIVLVTMAQPRWAMLKHVDDVILLERDRCVYCGTLRELLNTLRADPSSASVEDAINSLYQQASNPETSLTRMFGQNGNTERVRQSVRQFFQKCASGAETLDGPAYSSPGMHVQLYYMMKYELIQARNNILMRGSVFLLLVFLATVLSAVYTSQEGQCGMQNRIGIIFFLVSSTFLYSILSLDAQRKEYGSFLRHRAHGYYGACTFLIFAVLSCAFGRLFFLSVLTFVVFCISNIEEKWDYFDSVMQLVVVIGVLSFCSHFIVFFSSAIIWTRRFAMFTLFAIYTLNLLLAGIVLNLTTLPKVFQLISNISIIRLAYESSIVSQFDGRDFGCKSKNGSETCYTGPQYTAFLGFKMSRKWTNVGILVGISVLLVLGCLCVMVWQRSVFSRRHVTV